MASSSGCSKSNGSNQELKERSVRYRECWRNHAVLIGGYAADGCGEFTPKGGEGTQEAFLCQACDCHRNFHRKELIEDGKALVSSHHFPPSMWWGDGNVVVGSYPSPSAVSQLSSYHHHHYYSQSKEQDAVSDEESAIYSGSQGEMERKQSKKTRRKRTCKQVRL